MREPTFFALVILAFFLFYGEPDIVDALIHLLMK
jgi:hypothetical protein